MLYCTFMKIWIKSIDFAITLWFTFITYNPSKPLTLMVQILYSQALINYSQTLAKLFKKWKENTLHCAKLQQVLSFISPKESVCWFITKLRPQTSKQYPKWFKAFKIKSKGVVKFARWSESDHRWEQRLYRILRMTRNNSTDSLWQLTTCRFRRPFEYYSQSFDFTSASSYWCLAMLSLVIRYAQWQCKVSFIDWCVWCDEVSLCSLVTN